MKIILFLFFSWIASAWACSTAKKNHTVDPTQGLTGRITEAVGNQMPMDNAKKKQPRGILSEVLIYEPTNSAQVVGTSQPALYTSIRTKQVASATTDSTGHFTIALPVGSYSVFIKHKMGYYANLFDSENNIALFTVDKNKLTTANLTISLRASY